MLVLQIFQEMCYRCFLSG